MVELKGYGKFARYFLLWPVEDYSKKGKVRDYWKGVEDYRREVNVKNSGEESMQLNL